MKISFKKILFLFSICCSLEACKIYSFVGSNLDKDVKTFTVFCVLKTAKGPLNIENELKNTISKEITNRTTLKESKQNGDLNFKIFIVDYSVKPDNKIGPSSNLSITIELNFQNKYDSKANISKKLIYKTSSIKEEDLSYNKKSTKEVLEKITEEILQLTIFNW